MLHVAIHIYIWITWTPLYFSFSWVEQISMSDSRYLGLHWSQFFEHVHTAYVSHTWFRYKLNLFLYQKNLWNAWITISELRDTVTKKRHRLQLLRQKLKLASILKGQVSFIHYFCFRITESCLTICAKWSCNMDSQQPGLDLMESELLNEIYHY